MFSNEAVSSQPQKSIINMSTVWYRTHSPQSPPPPPPPPHSNNLVHPPRLHLISRLPGTVSGARTAAVHFPRFHGRHVHAEVVSVDGDWVRVADEEQVPVDCFSRGLVYKESVLLEKLLECGLPTATKRAPPMMLPSAAAGCEEYG